MGKTSVSDAPRHESNAENRKVKNIAQVTLSFLKTGAIGFGGGAALLPIFERELVENKQWMDKDGFNTSAVVASISPASLPVALCAVWDIRYSVVSSFMYTLPGALIYLALLTGFSFIGEAEMKYLKYTSVGLITFVLFLLFRFIRKNFLNCSKSESKKQYMSIMATVFLLSSGNVLRRLAGVLFGISLPVSVFAVNMMTLMIMAFFIIIFVGGSKSKIKLGAAFLLSGLYALANGKMGILGQWSLPLLIVMLILAAASVIYDAKRKRAEETERAHVRIDFKPIRVLSLFVLIAASFAAGTYFITNDAKVWDFAFKVLSSSLTSFGGGEVYIGISEAAFVQTGFIPEQIFNTQIIGIANTLPGPILVNIVTAVGFTYGNIAHGAGFGWLFGILGLVVAVTATAIGALALSVCFEALRDSRRLRMIIEYVMPIVCGILITTAISMLIQASSVLIGVGANAFLSIAIVIAIVAAMMFLRSRFRINDMLLLLLSGAGTVTVLGIIA